MRIIINILFILVVLFSTSEVWAKSRHKKKKSRSVSSRAKSTFRHRYKRHYHHGNGPDIKKITIDSPYTEAPTNGVNVIENNIR